MFSHSNVAVQPLYLSLYLYLHFYLYLYSFETQLAFSETKSVFSLRVAVRPRLKAIYLWESDSASQEPKTGRVFSFLNLL